ncbi:MAG: hypothetical protein ACR2RF_25305 [Geminicoccaceae bacterium]
MAKQKPKCETTDEKPPRYTSEELREHIERMSRDPFKELLATFMDGQPEANDIKELARRYPEAWTKAMVQVAHLAGFHERLEIEEHHIHAVIHMSDQELMRKLAETMQEIGGPAKVIEHEPDQSQAGGGNNSL